MFRGMADRRAAQGFTVYQTNLRSDPAFGGNPSADRQTSRYWVKDQLGTLPDVEFYQTELDRRMYYLADLGLVNALEENSTRLCTADMVRRVSILRK